MAAGARRINMGIPFTNRKLLSILSASVPRSGPATLKNTVSVGIYSTGARCDLANLLAPKCDSKDSFRQRSDCTE